MFSFLELWDDYEDRKVDRNEFDLKGVWILVSTALVTDSTNPYETFISFNGKNGKVVETYLSIEEARNNHRKWVNFICQHEITSLEGYVDQGTNVFATLLREFVP